VSDASRRDQLAESLRALRARIDAACARADRAPDDVRLLAVTKRFPAADAALLLDLGVANLAENRAQEAVGKAAELARLRPAAPARWHMVGRLQRNKARSVVTWADEVQSVDSPGLAEALAKAVRGRAELGDGPATMDVMIQVSLDDDPARGGCPAAGLPRLAERIAESGELRLIGLMAVAPLLARPEGAFGRLAELAATLRADHPHATEISAGMSGDLEVAIEYGSTCVRVGTALLGGRPLASP